jgi:hypothetical protein
MPLDNSETYKKLFSIFDTVGTKALKQTSYYRDSRSEVNGEVAAPGRRLNTGTVIAIGSLAAVIVLIYTMPVLAESIKQLLIDAF